MDANYDLCNHCIRSIVSNKKPQNKNNKIYIRSFTEYCSTVFHSSLTLKLQNKLEAIQKTCLCIIFGVMYVDYTSALEMCGLKSLHMRRDDKIIQFALKCTKHQHNQRIFPLNPSTDTHNVRHREKFKVNMAHTETYKKSSIPFLQWKLNEHYQQSIEELPGAG